MKSSSKAPTTTLTLATIPLDGFFRVLKAYRDRIVTLSEDPRFRYVLIFKNQGRAAGASLEHSHSQLIALPIVPELVQEELSGGKFYYNYKERCVFCDMIRQELQQQSPGGPGEPGISWPSVPLRPGLRLKSGSCPSSTHSSYVDLQEESFRLLAELFSETLKRLEKALGKVPVQFYPAHRAHPGVATELLPLAFRDRAQADPDRWFRMGLGLLHQSHPSGRCGQVSSGGDSCNPARDDRCVS